MRAPKAHPSSVTAVVAQNRTQAQALAKDLGVDPRWVFGASQASVFEGLRTHKVFIKEGTRLSDGFLDTIYATVLKTSASGQVVFVSATRYPREEL